WVAVGHSHRAHEARLLAVQKIHADGAMAVVRLLVGLGANDEGCCGDKLTLEMLSRSASRIGSVPVLANEALGIRVVHGYHKGAFGFWRHGRFTDAQGLVDAAKEPGQVNIAGFVG